MSTRENLAALEAAMITGDELMARVVDAFKERLGIAEEIESLERLRSVARAGASSFVVEAAGILKEEPQDLLFGSASDHTWHQ